jgi:hypothetical protein
MYIDAFKLKRIAREDVKLAELMYNNAMKKMRRTIAQQKQQDYENNSQLQAQTAQQNAASAAQLQQQKLDTEKQLAEYKALQDMKVEIVRGSFAVAAKGAEAQMPSWLMPIISQLVPNLTIPIAAENQLYQQQIQQAVQQPNQQQETPEMEQQEQMQPQ